MNSFIAVAFSPMQVKIASIKLRYRDRNASGGAMRFIDVVPNGPNMALVNASPWFNGNASVPFRANSPSTLDEFENANWGLDRTKLPALPDDTLWNIAPQSSLASGHCIRNDVAVDND
ncbi:hypothetical protein H257_14463 [Aphanomyces astaci]|uniref:Uncharacterized protein n=1 Tax=Aphanomyces astaci TaxID=112090 RepID=W4FT65_APHAT|nr:hypothetical protein H257_14463 [Aphanomyces astaci]ETV69848.1 hypothetical protein H257_14463 [Aphanomyces astaci]|eukprot:XP_009840586.1 hypothetical protein H257_14463 [Aphanomyces astaci]